MQRTETGLKTEDVLKCRFVEIARSGRLAGMKRFRRHVEMQYAHGLPSAAAVRPRGPGVAPVRRARANGRQMGVAAHEGGTAARRRGGGVWPRYTPASAGAFSYPGTPATEIFEFIEAARRPQRAACRPAGRPTRRWRTKRPWACRTPAGGRCVSMKHVGLNVAADPFINSALTGVNGGLVLVVADDPGMHSSQNEQDSRYYGEFAQIPVFEPANQQEAYDLTREAFEPLRAVRPARDGPPGDALVAQPGQRAGPGRRRIRRADSERLPRPDPNNWTLVPTNARRRFRRLLDMQPVLREWSEKSPYNTAEARRAGAASSRRASRTTTSREALGSRGDFSLLQIVTYPLPVEQIREPGGSLRRDHGGRRGLSVHREAAQGRAGRARQGHPRQAQRGAAARRRADPGRRRRGAGPAVPAGRRRRSRT